MLVATNYQIVDAKLPMGLYCFSQVMDMALDNLSIFIGNSVVLQMAKK